MGRIIRDKTDIITKTNTCLSDNDDEMELLQLSHLLKNADRCSLVAAFSVFSHFFLKNSLLNFHLLTFFFPSLLFSMFLFGTGGPGHSASLPRYFDFQCLCLLTLSQRFMKTPMQMFSEVDAPHILNFIVG